MKTKQIQILFIEPIKARGQHHFIILIMKRIHRCCPGIIFRLRKIRNHIGCSSAIGDDAMDSHIRSQLLTQYGKTVIDKDLCIQRIFPVFRAILPHEQPAQEIQCPSAHSRESWRKAYSQHLFQDECRGQRQRRSHILL